MAFFIEEQCCGKNGTCESIGFSMRHIFLGNKGYAMCKKCFSWFRKIGQVSLKWPKAL